MDLTRLLSRWLVLADLLISLVPAVAGDARAETLANFLAVLATADLHQDADAIGAIREEYPVAPVLKSGETVAWAFLSSDFVGTTGYSGKPIHVVAAIDSDVVQVGVKLTRALGRGSLAPERTGPMREIDLSITDSRTWPRCATTCWRATSTASTSRA